MSTSKTKSTQASEHELSQQASVTEPATTAGTDEGTAVATDEAGENIQGRGVFAVETTAIGIAVHTGFLAQDNRLLRLPAIFPDLDYALAQIDELRALVKQHFAQAAQVGAQVMAAQAAAARDANAAESAAESASMSAASKTAGSAAEQADTTH